MNETARPTRVPLPDWDPLSDAVRRDPRSAYDEIREQCPVAYSHSLHWSLFRHDDVVRVLEDPATFSSAASRHLSVPNGMDPPEHTEYRRIIDPYFGPDAMKSFEPRCREISVRAAQAVCGRAHVEVMSELADPFAAQVQCAFLSWPAEVQKSLRKWTRNNFEATRAQDRKAMAAVAREFEAFVVDLLQTRRRSGAPEDGDMTSRLLREQVRGRPLRDEEITSLLRNWTVGEVGTIAASVGILVQYLAVHPDLQDRLRTQPSLLAEAIDEILRLHGPLLANRRVTTRQVQIRGRTIDAGERISLIWIAANRDGGVFEDPGAFRLGRDPSQNLLYGRGIHVCPGAPLARLELRVLFEELLARTKRIEGIPSDPPLQAVYPAGGFATVPVRIE